MKNVLNAKVILGWILLIIWLFPGSSLAGLVNGGFEMIPGGSGWISSGDFSVQPMVSLDLVWNDASQGSQPFSPREKDHMAALSWNTQTGDFWNNTFSQEITLTENDNYLSFWYNFWSYDEGNYDGFKVELDGFPVLSYRAGDIDTMSGSVSDTQTGTLDYTGWQFFSIDISGYYDSNRSSDLRVSFFSGNTGDDSLPSGVFIDAVRVSEVELPNVPVPTSLLLMASGLLGFAGLKRRS